MQQLAVRELQSGDMDHIINYWLSASADFLEGMGADIRKIPRREEWVKMLSEQLNQSYHEKKSYCIIWLEDDRPIGHSNVNKIIFGEEAYMHLHLWQTETRRKGAGTELIRMTLPFFFRNLELKKVYCEPYALNPAPNKTLERVGFKFIRQHTTTPGYLNFEQSVNLWEMSLDMLEKTEEVQQ